jgi:hypothetical protein
MIHHLPLHVPDLTFPAGTPNLAEAACTTYKVDQASSRIHYSYSNRHISALEPTSSILYTHTIGTEVLQF